MKDNSKKKILIATAFPTYGAGSGVLVTTQAKSYVEDGHQVVIITGNNKTDFDKLEGINYHVVPFTAETENPEKIEGQLPFNYLMFTTHTESTENFWNVNLKELEQYCQAFKVAVQDEVNRFNPDVIHAQHNWLLSSITTQMGKPVVTTIHGTDLMGYEKSKIKLAETIEEITNLKEQAQSGNADFSINDLNKIEEVYKRSSSADEIMRNISELIKSKKLDLPKSTLVPLLKMYEDKKKYEFYISESEKSARNSEKIICISDDQKEKFASLFPFAEEKVVLLENGYDANIFYMDPSVDKDSVLSSLTSDNTPDGKIPTDYDDLILFVGKFADFKGIDSLLIATKQYEDQLINKGRKPLTLIVGSGALEPKFKAEAKQLELKNTHFVGRQPINVVRNLQNLATVSLIPSRNEPFGLVVLEGTACGHPVIGSNSGGIPGILNTTKEPLPENQDIIQTKIGVLVKPLPERPSTLNDEEKDQLDILATDYVVSEDAKKEELLNTAQNQLNLPKEELQTYLDEYAQSTTALSDSVIKIVNNELAFDRKEIEEYTKSTYSQEIIREKLINIFDEAIKLHSQDKSRD